MIDLLQFVARKVQQGISSAFNLLTIGYFHSLEKHSANTAHSIPPKMKKIIILGGSYAGVSTAHRILKQAAKSANSIIPFKIILVSPNTDLYWNMASPRAILPGQLTDDQLFQPIAAGFTKYSPDQFEFILGYATRIDVDKQTVTISATGGLSDGDGDGDALKSVVLDYNHLILATGSRTRNGTPLKGLGSTDKTKAALHHFQGQIDEAKVIVVAGGGVTGIEVAGELGFQYGRTKEIILVSATDCHPRVPPKRLRSSFKIR
jgi:NADH dehydrogenase FAD-containing subunit